MSAFIKKDLKKIPSPLSNNLHYKSNDFQRLDKEEILNSTQNGLKIIEFIFDRKGINLEIGRTIRNPFYNDKNPSFFINLINGAYVFYDFGNNDYKGDVFNLAAFYYNLDVKHDFLKILENINDELSLGLKSKTSFKNSERLLSSKDFSIEDLSYWNQYGIKEDLLVKYNVKSVEWFKISGNNSPRRIEVKEELAFAYCINGNSYKIYQPNNPMYKFSWVGHKPDNYIFGFDKLDYSLDTVIITAGEKDALCLLSMGYNAICFNSETSGIDSGTISLLKESFDYVLICYDNDATGKKESEKIAKKYGLSIIDIEYILYKYSDSKDLADYFKNSINQDLETDFRELKNAISHSQHVYNSITNQLPSPFPLKIYNLLPQSFQDVLANYQSFPEKEMILLTMISVVSGLLPNYSSVYDRKVTYSNLYLYVTGSPASGKGAMADVKAIGSKVHQNLSESCKTTKLSDSKQLFAPGNSSYRSILTLLENNDNGLILFETEGDVFNDNNKQEWGNFSTALRQAFQHETISFSRHLENIYYENESPKITCIISSTQKQFINYFKSPENGLYSRFIIFNLLYSRRWRNVFEETKPINYYNDLADWSVNVYNILKTRKIEFRFKDSQKSRLNEVLELRTSNCNYTVDNNPVIATEMRLGSILTRVAMILSILNYKQIDDIYNIECTDDTLEVILSLIEPLISNALYSMMRLPNVPKNLSNQVKQPEILYHNLPESFERKTALEIGRKYNIKEDYIDKILRNTNKFKKIGRGTYKKVHRSTES